MQDFHVALKSELFVEDSAAVVALQVVQVAGGAFDLLAHEAVEHAEVPLQAEIEQDKKSSVYCSLQNHLIRVGIGRKHAWVYM